MAPTSLPPLGKRTIRNILSCATTSGGPSISELSDVKDVLEDVMASCLQDVVARFQSYFSKCKMLKEKKRFDPDRVKKRLLRTESYLMDKFRQKEDMILYTKDPSQHRHIIAWRRCHTNITRDLCNLNGVLDHLCQDDVLSVADVNSISEKTTSRARTEEFYRYIEGRTEDEFLKSVVPAIQRENEHLADTILQTIEEVDERPEDYKCTACLVNSIVQVKKLASHLFESRKITSSLYGDLRSGSLSNQQKWKELKDANISDLQIIKALHPKYPDLYWALKRRNKKTLDCFCGEKCDAGSSVSGIFSKSPPSGSNDSFVMENSGDIANVDELEDVESIMDTEILEYPMTARPRGYCVIVNNKFSTGFETARDINVKKIEEVFKKLEFRVVKYEQLTSDELYDHLSVIAKKRHHSRYNAFVCYLFCQCVDDQILGCDREPVPLAELKSLFGATSCPSLAGKPKLFFIESSRGRKYARNISLQPASKSKPPEVQENDPTLVPDEADFCIAYSTAPGFKCFLKPKTGFSFSHCVTDILDSQADRHEFVTCLSMVNEHVVKRCGVINSSSGSFSFPVPTFMSTLTRKVNLTSSPIWPTPLSPKRSSFADRKKENPRKKRKTDHVYGKV